MQVARSLNRNSWSVVFEQRVSDCPGLGDSLERTGTTLDGPGVAFRWREERYHIYGDGISV